MGMTENGSATSRELARPHPEERACSRAFANSNERARVSKDEDGADLGSARELSTPSCFETARHGALKTRVNALKARLLSMRESKARRMGPSCFETPRCARLLSMRGSRSRERNLVQSKGCGFFLFSSCSVLL